MDKQAAIMVVALALLPTAIGVGVTQDYMPDGVVASPIGKTTCHRIWVADTPDKELIGHVELLSPLPDYVYVDIQDEYEVKDGSSIGIIFAITPLNETIGRKDTITFRVTADEAISEGQVPIVSDRVSQFTIQVVSSNETVPDRCQDLEVRSTPLQKEETAPPISAGAVVGQIDNTFAYGYMITLATLIGAMIIAGIRNRKRHEATLVV